MSTLTAEEVRENYLQKMGPELGAIMHRLYNECAWLHVKWAEYCGLFGASPARIELLNDAAPRLFRIIQDSMWNDVLLHISRLTDPPVLKHRETLSTLRLPRLVDPAIKDDVTKCVEKVLAEAAFARDSRNRRLAHADLDDALERSVRPEIDATRAKVRSTLKAIVETLNCVESFYKRLEVWYDFDDHSAETMLYRRLRDGLEAERARHARKHIGVEQE